jgi:DNA-binding HxlR family transcriptional regulator
MLVKAQKLADLLKLLSNKYRLVILCSLISGPKTVTEILAFTSEISKSALSQHLNIMKTAGLLSSNKKAQFVSYSIADKRVLEILGVLKEHYCVDT